MKRFLYVILPIMAMFLSHCGKDGIDGVDGEAFIAYDWVNSWLTLTSNDPAIPQIVERGFYYNATVGTWDFSYTAWDSSYWSSSYTIYKNKGTNGTAGGIVSDGEDGVDGDDVYFVLDLYGAEVGGPDFTAWDYAFYYPTAKVFSGVSAKDRDQQAKADRNGNLVSRIDTVINGERIIEGEAGPYNYVFRSKRIK